MRSRREVARFRASVSPSTARLSGRAVLPSSKWQRSQRRTQRSTNGTTRSWRAERCSSKKRKSVHRARLVLRHDLGPKARVVMVRVLLVGLVREDSVVGLVPLPPRRYCRIRRATTVAGIATSPSAKRSVVRLVVPKSASVASGAGTVTTTTSAPRSLSARLACMAGSRPQHTLIECLDEQSRVLSTHVFFAAPSSSE